MPARAALELVTLPAQVTTVYGSLRRGRAGLVGGYRVDWEVVLSGLLRLQVPLDVVLSGPDTQVTGRIVTDPWRIAARDVSGRMGPGLLTLLPGILVESCSSRAIVDIPQIARTRNAAVADGAVRIDAGTCTQPGGRTVPVPQMLAEFSAEGADISVTVEDSDSRLARATMTADRRLILRVEREGAALVPGLPTGGPIILEYPL